VETYRRVSDLRDTFLALAVAANWHSRDGKAIIFRLVTVLHFPAKVATARPDLLPQRQMVHCLGQIFDSTAVQDRWLRLLASHWWNWRIGWETGRAPDPTLRTRAGGRPRGRPPPLSGAENAAQADRDAANLSNAGELLAGSTDGSSTGSDGSSDDSSEQKTASGAGRNLKPEGPRPGCREQYQVM